MEHDCFYLEDVSTSELNHLQGELVQKKG